MKQSRTAAGVGPGNPAAAAPYDYAPVGGPSGGYGSYNQQQLQHGGPTAQQYGQLGQGQYNDTSAPAGQYTNNNRQVAQHGDFNQQQQGAADAGPPPPNCDCGGPASTRTSNSARNPGRQFFSCGKPMGDDGRCNFFKWVDALAAGGGGSQAGGRGGTADAGEVVVKKNLLMKIVSRTNC
jgi:DNA topoisomerase-3